MRRKDREVSNTEDIKHIIEKCKVCHLAMVDKGLPYVVPLNFGYIVDGNSLTLFFHSAKTGRKLDIFNENNAVCFEMVCEGKLGYVEIRAIQGITLKVFTGLVMLSLLRISMKSVMHSHC